ncbi:TetR/AcrR family transcriptional regulator [Bacillus sp. TH13]|uniref:TetR/AcrR family transcriptional regulator n=1 Tax=Bacillus sp. TH13 TaxID=2796379 RepID=UPI001913139A|nr:TetR/AcrR family transcriptional regulator [Bacillus sp. TH13]MBK5491801.1 TetR/AcrR family transcriptional regulator [Bacillus sp. TH13]
MNQVDTIRDVIIQNALILFNKKGYGQTSIQDIMEATGLPKGAIYRRFENKNEIAIAAFAYSGDIIWKHFSESTKSKNTALDKLIAMFEVYQDAAHNPPVDGGCPLLNTAIEADYGLPALREKVVEEYNRTLFFIQAIIEEGIKSKEFKQGLDSYGLASFLLSTIEGAIMASRLSLNNEHIIYSIEQVKILLQNHLEKNQI